MQVTTFVKKAEARYETDFDALPTVTQDFVINYGWRQCIADAAASAKDAKEAKGLCDKRFDNLVKGIIRAERESDPVAREAKRLAVEKTNAWAKANGVPLTFKDDATDKVKDAVDANLVIFAERVAKLKVHPAIVAQAQANIAALAALGDIDLDDI